MGVALPSYDQRPAPAWCADYVGLPYEEGGRGPDKFDCWGVAMLVAREQFGLPVPDYDGVHWGPGHRGNIINTARVIADEAAGYDEVRPGFEEPGDFIVLSIAGRPLHVGVVAVPGWMIHGTDGADSALERYDGMVWRCRVEAFYRRRP